MAFDEDQQQVEDQQAGSGYRGLILIGSGQGETAAFLLTTLHPERVAVLLSPQAKAEGFSSKVADLLGGMTCDWQEYDLADTTATEVYRALKEVHEQWSDLSPGLVVADVTGGTKQMSVGMAKAAHLLGLPTVHVESRYKNNAIEVGSQRLVILPDPYQIFGDLEAADAQRMYGAHDYLGAGRIYEDLANRLSLSTADAPTAVTAAGHAARYSAYALLAGAYAAWDVFDFRRAAELLKKLLISPYVHKLDAQLPILSAQLDGLAQINDGASSGGSTSLTVQVIANLNFMRPLLGSLYSCALRRAASGRYDFAAFLLYRCLEMLEQNRLASYGVLTEKPRWDALRQSDPQLEARYKQVQRRHKRYPLYPLPDRGIPLFAGYMLLEALGDYLVAGYDIGRIEQRTEARNKSFLAHGYRSITVSEYEDFKAVVDTMLDRFFKSGSERLAWQRTYMFVNPFQASER